MASTTEVVNEETSYLNHMKITIMPEKRSKSPSKCGFELGFEALPLDTHIQERSVTVKC